MRSVALRTAPVAAVLLTFVGGSGPAPRAQPPPRMVFPVVRSDWYSVINFTDDWHAPRLRRTPDGWKLIGRHEGNDVFAEPGTPVVAILGGRVERLGWTFYSGWRVGVRGVDGRYWFYAHLGSFAPGLTIGSPIAAGRLLGKVGNTGYGVTPGHRDEFTYHLHLGIQEPDGTWVNPYPLVRRLYDAAVKKEMASPPSAEPWSAS